MRSVVNRTFDEVYVINLDRSPERLATIDAQLRKLNIHYKRIRAVDGKQLTREQRLAATTRLCTEFCTPGAIGCALSHKKAWQDIVRRGLRNALVLEDDAVFGNNFEQRFAASWRDVPDDWAVVYLGCFSSCGDRWNYSIPEWLAVAQNPNRGPKCGQVISPRVVVPDAPTGTHAYAITNRAARLGLMKLHPQPFPAHIDLVLAHTMRSNNYQLYAFTDGSLITQGTAFDDTTVGAGGSPYLANYLLDHVTINRRGVHAGWFLSEAGLRIGPAYIAAWQGVFILLGVLLGARATKWFAFAMMLDSIVFGKEVKFAQLAFDIGLFHISAVLSSRYLLRRK